MTVKGKESQTKLKSGRLTFIVRAGKNDIDPKSVFGVFQFKVKKKTREFVLAEAGILSGIQSTTNFNTVPTQVKKYGTESYLVVIEKQSQDSMRSQQQTSLMFQPSELNNSS